jgi:hypothetical protein
MLGSKVLKKAAVPAKKKLESEIQRLVKAKKLTVKEGKVLTKKILKVVKAHGTQVKNLVLKELKNDYIKSKPLIRKIGSKAKKKAKVAAGKALRIAKSKTRNLAGMAARKIK